RPPRGRGGRPALRCQLGTDAGRSGLLASRPHGPQHRVGGPAQRPGRLDGSVRHRPRPHAAPAHRRDSTSEPINIVAHAARHARDARDLLEPRRGALHVLCPAPAALSVARRRDPPALRPAGDASGSARPHALRHRARVDRLAARLALGLVRDRHLPAPAGPGSWGAPLPPGVAGERRRLRPGARRHRARLFGLRQDPLARVQDRGRHLRLAARRVPTGPPEPATRGRLGQRASDGPYGAREPGPAGALRDEGPRVRLVVARDPRHRRDDGAGPRLLRGRRGAWSGGLSPLSRKARFGVLWAGMDAERFDALVATHHGEIYRYLLRATSRRTEADDLAQDTFLRAYRAHRTLPPDANARAWL